MLFPVKIEDLHVGDCVTLRSFGLPVDRRATGRIMVCLADTRAARGRVPHCYVAYARPCPETVRTTWQFIAPKGFTVTVVSDR